MLSSHPDQGAHDASFAPDVLLDADDYERGVAAHRAASEGLHDVTDALGDIENQADKLLDELLALLDEPASEGVSQ